MEQTKLYTGYGDKGYTQTLSQKRISKADALIDLIGTLDEFSAAIGIAKTQTGKKDLRKDIEAIEKKMISVMGELAGGKVSVTEDCIRVVEEMTDRYDSGAICDFTQISSTPLSAQLNFARTVIRRAERIGAKVMQTGRIRPLTLVYINRMSDLLYAMARNAQADKAPQIEAEGAVVMQELTLNLAKEISLAVEMRAEQLGKRLVVAITDAGANLMLLHSMTGAYLASCQIAQDKAYTSVALKMPTQTALEESRGGSLDGLGITDRNRLCLLGGGAPLIAGGRIIGGVGVSGGTAEEDTAFAEFAALYLERRLSDCE
ncbi:MAG: cob(I)yrinic acid a,c-diamide adenosyltransferase [Ruminococcaceae bacterium]|nr:cob(I)yrinic acid a,c-diamide adenosyltransferase [Oscillospiraceae bacterium]